MAKQTRTKKPIPFRFVLEELEPLAPVLKPMFGCHAIYIGEKIVLFLCDREDLLDPEEVADQKGVWVATTVEAHASLAAEFSSVRARLPEELNQSPWLRLSASAPDFETQALRACELILQGDPRIGRIPKQQKLKPPGKELQKKQ
jgi:hypothetical protein